MLFTSYANMNAVAERLAGRLAYPLLIQGEAPKAALLETFRATPGAVLLATGSFWQGVDVVGDQLSCVIIDKLPFASPGDPVVSARIERLRSRGGNPFAEYQVPVAVLMLKQGLGRLIRSGSDRGVLAVLDSRLVERPYGKRFLASLPPARVIHELDAVTSFFAEEAAVDGPLNLSVLAELRQHLSPATLRSAIEVFLTSTPRTFGLLREAGGGETWPRSAGTLTACVATPASWEPAISWLPAHAWNKMPKREPLPTLPSAWMSWKTRSRRSAERSRTSTVPSGSNFRPVRSGSRRWERPSA